MIKKCVLLFVSVLFLPSFSGADTRSAADVVAATGVKGGLVVQVGFASGRQIADLRINDRFVVQGLHRDVAHIQQARQSIHLQGQYGPVTVKRFDGKHLPYTDNLVNLLIVSSDTFRIPEAEMMRALTPGGVALVNGRQMRKPWPSGIDEWTHFLHSPNNNAVAQDTCVAPPRYTQWVAGPRWGRSHDHLASMSAAVSASGRIFAIIDEGSQASVKAPSRWMLVARDAFNGVLLWKREISPWENQLRPFRSGPAELPRRLVAVGERVYVTLGYGKPVCALDAATGQVLHTYAGTENTHEILVQGDKLYLVVSAPLAEESPTTGKILRRLPVWRGSYQEFVTQYMPKHVVVVDAQSGRQVWQKQDKETTHLLPLTLTVDKDRVFFQNETHLMSLNAQSGAVLWRTPRPSVRHRYAWLTPTVVVQDGVLLSADRSPQHPVDTGGADETQMEWRVSANHILTGGDIMAFSAQDGKHLWTAPAHEGFNAPVDLFVTGGKVYSGILAWGKQPGITQVYDLQTGQVVGARSPDQEKYTLGFGHARCYRHKATSRYIIHGRAGVEFLDLNADEVDASHWVRGTCQYGILPCNGLVYVPTHPCACYVTAKLSGFNALAGRALTHTPGSTLEQLEKGPAYAAAQRQRAHAQSPNTSKAGADPREWSTYRGNPARSASAAASLGSVLRVKWERALPGPLTALVCAGGRLYLAQSEAHTVHALDAHSGTPIWHYTVAGRVDSPPTVFNGLVYFGAADGWMYCLRALDGELVWRFRVAPGARQVGSYGQLASAWPVPGNVLVYRGADNRAPALAYVVAGRSSYVDGGVQLCAVDALTGDLAFRRNICHLDPETGQEPQETIRGTNMPGAMPDVLCTDGSSLFMRHQRFDFSGQTLEQNVDHLYCSAGLLDDTGWHRTYLQIGSYMNAGYGGWGAAGNTHISGRTLVRTQDRAFGWGRKEYTVTGSHLGMQSEFHLFCADAELIRPSQAKNKKRKPKTQVKYIWSRDIPFYARAMLLTRDTLWVAGPADVLDFAVENSSADVWLWAVSAKDGSKAAAYSLRAAPVYDGLATAYGNLYLSTVDGRVVCYQTKM